jgi:hypothetical protein
MIVKPISIMPIDDESGGRASKAIELTSADLRQVTES